MLLIFSCNEEIIIPEKNFSYEILSGNVGGISSISINGDGDVAAWAGNSTYVILISGRRLSGHISTINSVDLNRAGSLVLSGSNDNNIKLWDVNTGTLLRTFSEHITTTKRVKFTPDETSVLSAEGNYIVYWRSAVSGFIAPLRMYGHLATVSSVEMNNDMTKIISGSNDGTIKIWNEDTGELIHSINAHNGYTKDVKIDPTANRFASCGTDSTIKIWDLNTFELINILKKYLGKINTISYHYSGNYIACGGFDNNIYIWDIKSSTIVVTLTAHEKPVNSIEFSSSGDDLISGGADGKVIIWRNVFSKK